MHSQLLLFFVRNMLYLIQQIETCRGRPLHLACGKMEGPHPDKFAFAQRSGAMKAPVGLLSDRTVLRSKMEGTRPDKFQFAVQRQTEEKPLHSKTDAGAFSLFTSR